MFTTEQGFMTIVTIYRNAIRVFLMTIIFKDFAYFPLFKYLCQLLWDFANFPSTKTDKKWEEKKQSPAK